MGDWSSQEKKNLFRKVKLRNMSQFLIWEIAINWASSVIRAPIYSRKGEQQVPLLEGGSYTADRSVYGHQPEICLGNLTRWLPVGVYPLFLLTSLPSVPFSLPFPFFPPSFPPFLSLSFFPPTFPPSFFLPFPLSPCFFLITSHLIRVLKIQPPWRFQTICKYAYYHFLPVYKRIF